MTEISCSPRASSSRGTENFVGTFASRDGRVVQRVLGSVSLEVPAEQRAQRRSRLRRGRGREILLVAVVHTATAVSDLLVFDVLPSAFDL